MGLLDFGEELLSFGVDVAKETAKSYAKQKVAEAVGKGVTNILDGFTGQQSSQNYNAPQAQLPEYNNVEDIVSKANEYYDNKDYEKAFSLYAEAAEQGDEYAQYSIGWCYQYGQGVDIDYEEAAFWYKKAIDGGSSNAKEALEKLGSNTDCLIQKDNLYAIRKGFITQYSLSDVSYSYNNEDVTIKIGRLQNESAHHSGSVKLIFWFGKTKYDGKHMDGFPMAESLYNSNGSRGDQYGWSDVEFTMDMDGNPPTGNYFPVVTVNELDEDGSWYIVGYCNFDKKQHWNHEEDALGVDDMISLADEHWNNEEYEEAAELFLEAAEQGNAYAQYSIGYCYEKGTGTNQDFSKALKWYRKAAEQGNANAQYSLGYCYLLGNGVEKSEREGVRWFRKAAEQGHAAAQYGLGLCHEDGTGVKQSYGEAIGWYRKAAEQGDEGAKEAIERVTALMKNQNNTNTTIEKRTYNSFDDLEEAAEQGNADAQYHLGLCYEEGNNVPNANCKKAVEWYEKAAKQGNVDAMYRIGICYAHGGLGIPQNYTKAREWYKKAAANGHKEALAEFSSDSMDYDKMLNAAEHGNVEAQYNLGLCYEKGNNVFADCEKAIYWFEIAAKNGSVKALCALGNCYAHGGLGVPQNYAIAVDWYKKAAEKGHKEAKIALWQINNGSNLADVGNFRDSSNSGVNEEYIINDDLGEVITTEQHSNATNELYSNNEQEYIDTLKEIIAYDGEITDRERRLLEKLRAKLGISESRAKELEDTLANPSLTAEEQEYLDEYKSIAADGEITDKERKLLDKIRKMSGISEERAREIEKIVFPEKTKFDVIIKATGSKIFDVVKVVKTLTGLGLKETKELIDSVPKAIKEGVTKDEAESIKNQLIEVGADVYII